MKNLLILGAGTGGTMIANEMSRKLDRKEWKINVIDKSDYHYYQPSYIFLPFKLYGYNDIEQVRKPIRSKISSNVYFTKAEVNLIDHENRKVETSAGDFEYDWLVLSMGCHVVPEEVDGMAEGMGKNVHTYYNPEGTMAMQRAVENFTEGKFVVHISEVPYKCPVAPLEMMFLADYYFTKKGIRDRVEMEFVTPLAGAFTKPIASAKLSAMAEERNIKITPNFVPLEVDSEKGEMSEPGGKVISFDLLATIPPNLGPAVIEDSGLGNGAGFCATDNASLKSEKAERVFAIGDNTDVPTSKAGSVTHFQVEILVENLLAEINGGKATASSDGHSNCFIETGYQKAILIDFNYDIQPLPGKFPFAGVGPFALLEESRINHMGKMGFDWFYWNMLLPARMPSGPWAPTKMSLSGKQAELLST